MIIDRIRIISQDLVDASETQFLVDLYLNLLSGQNGYQLKAQDGLDPSDTYGYSEGYDNSGIPIPDNFPEDKLITLKIGFVPGVAGTVSALRDALYRLQSRPVYLHLFNGINLVSYISGYIRKLDAPSMSNVMESVVVIECDDGFFRTPSDVIVPTGSLSKTLPVIDYTEGTAPAPFEMVIALTAGMSSFKLTGTNLVNDQDTWHFEIGYTFLTGDIITIHTDHKTRYVTVTRSAVTTDISAYVTAGSIWPRLQPIRNAIKLSSASFNWTSLKYTPKFWGV